MMEDKYYLAVETKPNNYFPVELLNLSIAKGFTTQKLDELDNFTLKFTKKEIKEAIKEANLLEITDDMDLVIIYNEKKRMRKTQILTKDLDFDMWAYIKVQYNDKNFRNKIYNFLANKISKEELERLKGHDTWEEFVRIILAMPYVIQRKLYFYLYELL